MAEEDYDIDFYGDTSGNDQQNVGDHKEGHDYQDDTREDGNHGNSHHDRDRDHDGHHHEHEHDYHEHEHEHEQSNAKPEGEDRGSVDPGATSALMVSELNWYTTDDDIRGWLRQGGCEEGLKDITFSEHKVNGKSKGYAFVTSL